MHDWDASGICIFLLLSSHLRVQAILFCSPAFQHLRELHIHLTLRRKRSSLTAPKNSSWMTSPLTGPSTACER
ncbi:hypothetical protein DAI22_07g077800 [Oryza sativa Japonica Group]|nr:hypothetical protein DAI22_07g077800 [Oryza sativa Japonica Group]